MKQEEFVEKWQKRFPNFNFSKTIYKGSKLPVKVICEKGHLFTRVANQMFRGCSVCGRQRSIKKHTNTISELEERFKLVHEEEFYIPIFTEGNLQEKIIVICNICGDIYLQTKASFLSGRRRKNCDRQVKSNLKAFTIKEFIEKSKLIHGNKYDYSKSIYINKKTKLEIICPKCGNSFFTTPDNHWKGSGCNICKVYQGEEKIKSYLIDRNIIFESQKTFDDLRDKRKLSYDFYIPSKNLLIEYNGKQHYIKSFGMDSKQFHLQLHHDWLKRKYARDNNINLLIISYKDDIDKILEYL